MTGRPSREREYLDGYRAASKDAVEYLMKEARAMNDPSARDRLNGASFSLGNHLKGKWKRMSGQERARD